MAKPVTVDKNAVMRLQKIGGGTAELRGVFACQIEAEIFDRFVINMDSPGHHTVGVFGGILKQTEQTSLPLNDPDKDKKTKSTTTQIIANMAPASDDIKAIKTVLAKKIVEDVAYDDDTGLYVITIGPGDKKKGKRFRLTFTNGTVSPVEPKKKTEKPKPTDQATPGNGEAYSEKDYVKLINIDKSANIYTNVIALLILGEESKNIDRWRWAAGVGLDDEGMIRHIAESFGGTKGRIQKIGDHNHQLYGKTKKPGICFCLELGEDELPAWMNDVERELLHGDDGKLIRVVREVMKVPQPIV